MKKYIFILLTLPILFFVNMACSDDKEIDYRDDGRYPPPVLLLSSPSKIDIVEYQSNVEVVGISTSEIGIRDIYVTEAEKNEDGTYREIDKKNRIYQKIESLANSQDVKVSIKVKSENTTGLMLVVTDVLTKQTEKVITFGKVEGIPSKISSESNMSHL